MWFSGDACLCRATKFACCSAKLPSYAVSYLLLCSCRRILGAFIFKSTSTDLGGVGLYVTSASINTGMLELLASFLGASVHGPLSGSVRAWPRIFAARACTCSHLRTQELWIGVPRTNGGRCRPQGDASGQFWSKAVFYVWFIRPSADRALPFRARRCCLLHLHMLLCSFKNPGGGPKGIPCLFTVVQFLQNQSVNSQIHFPIP